MKTASLVKEFKFNNVGKKDYLYRLSEPVEYKKYGDVKILTRYIVLRNQEDDYGNTVVYAVPSISDGSMSMQYAMITCHENRSHKEILEMLGYSLELNFEKILEGIGVVVGYYNTEKMFFGEDFTEIHGAKGGIGLVVVVEKYLEWVTVTATATLKKVHGDILLEVTSKKFFVGDISEESFLEVIGAAIDHE